MEQPPPEDGEHQVGPGQPDGDDLPTGWLRGVAAATGRGLLGTGGRVLTVLWLGAVGIWVAAKVARRILRPLTDAVSEEVARPLVRGVWEAVQFVTEPGTKLTVVAMLGASVLCLLLLRLARRRPADDSDGGR